LYPCTSWKSPETESPTLTRPLPPISVYEITSADLHFLLRFPDGISLRESRPASRSSAASSNGWVDPGRLPGYRASRKEKQATSARRTHPAWDNPTASQRLTSCSPSQIVFPYGRTGNVTSESGRFSYPVEHSIKRLRNKSCSIYMRGT